MTKANQISQQLKGAVQDNVRFDALIETIRNDRDIRTTEMRAIASEFLGWEIKRGRAAALQAIVECQMVAARQDARRAQISKHMRTW
jgi:hypothetical protein